MRYLPIHGDFDKEIKRKYYQTSPQLKKSVEPELPRPFVFKEMPGPKLVRGDVIWVRRKYDRSKPDAWEKFVIKQRTAKKCRYRNTNYYGPYWTVADINALCPMRP